MNWSNVEWKNLHKVSHSTTGFKAGSSKGGATRPRDSAEWLGRYHENRTCGAKSDEKSYVERYHPSHSAEALGVNNQWDVSTVLNFDLLKNGRYWFVRLSLQMFVELYRENFAMEWCKPTLQWQKHRLRISCKLSLWTPLEGMFPNIEECIRNSVATPTSVVVGVEWWLDLSNFNVRALSEVSRDSDIKLGTTLPYPLFTPDKE